MKMVEMVYVETVKEREDLPKMQAQSLLLSYDLQKIGLVVMNHFVSSACAS